MPELENRVNTLEQLSEQLLKSQEQTQQDLQQLSKEMSEFKDEMSEFKNEMSEFKNEINKKWGELANRMGTVVEDIITPNLEHIAKQFFDLDDYNTLLINAKKKNKSKTKRKEFDVIIEYEDVVILNETKTTPNEEKIKEFAEFIESKKFYDYFPDYQEYRLIPIFSSISIDPELVDLLSENNIYAASMKGNYMTILNEDRVS